MDTSIFPAITALAGSLIGASASVATSWLTQNGQYTAQQRISDRTRREALYSEFIIEASSRFAEAIQAESPEVGQFVTLMALVSRIRLFADDDTIAAAEAVITNLLPTYFAASIKIEDMRDKLFEERSDPLLQFSQEARRELLRLR